MKSLILFIVLTINLTSFSQTTDFFNRDSVKFAMVDFTNFKYSKEISVGDAIDSNKIIYDTLTYFCDTKFTFNFLKNEMIFSLPGGFIQTNKIIINENNNDNISVDVDITNEGIFNFLLSKNIDGNISMIVRNRVSENGFIVGYFTNKIQITE